jgi:Ni,Fe-hydrogenase maturation factor
MGNDTSKATGTDWDINQANRDLDNQADDIPSIPFGKQKEIMAKLVETVKKSIWLANFKRAFRGYLRKGAERNQEGTFQKILQLSKTDADYLGLPKDSFNELLNGLIRDLGPIFLDDTVDFLVERQKLVRTDPEDTKNKIIFKYQKILFTQVTQFEVIKIGREIYKKYSRGADADVSDAEIDPEMKAKMQAEKEAKAKAAAEERRRQAEQWAREAAEEQAMQEERERALKKRQEEQEAINDALI